jgi:hypothetical protein
MSSLEMELQENLSRSLKNNSEKMMKRTDAKPIIRVENSIFGLYEKKEEDKKEKIMMTKEILPPEYPSE